MGDRILYTTFLAHLVDDGCEVVMAPLIPLIAKEFSFSNVQIGILGGVLVIALGLFQFLMGYISDYLKKKKDMVVFGFLLMSLSFYLISLANSFFHIVVFTFFVGVGLSFYHPIGVSVITTHFKIGRGKAIGIHGVGGAVGLLIFPAYSGFLAHLYGWRFVLKVTPIICILVALLYYFSVTDISFEKSNRKLSLVLSSAAILVMIVLGITSMANRGFTTFFPVRLDGIGYGSGFYGSLLSIFLGIGIFGQYIGGVLSDKISYRKIISSSLVLTALFLVPLLLVESAHMIYLFGALAGLSISIVWPAIFAYIAEITPEDMHSRSLGIFFSVAAAMGGSSPILIGYATKIITLEHALLILPLTALIGAVLMLGVRR
ncbi:MAG: MFS transporter [Methanomicrobia archaeon]|nr:MFS transporter [Methanomicrobia archaeon]